MVWHRNALRAYRALLFAYPSDFRHEYGSEMERLFALRLGEESPALLCLEVLADIAISAVREHWHILTDDLRHSARSLGKTPSFTIAALLVIAVGVGATTTVFSVVNAVLLRSLPYGNPEQLVYMWTPVPVVKDLLKEIAPPYADVYAWRKMSRSFAGITALQSHTFLLNTANPVHVSGALVLGNFFQTMKVVPQLGRLIDASDDSPGQQRVVVISDSVWRANFGRTANVIGKTIQLDRQSYRVIGVMAKGFAFPHGTDLPQALSAAIKTTDLWIPAALNIQQQSDRSELADEPDLVIGRLSPGVDLVHAQAEMSAIEKRLALLNTEFWRYSTSLLVPFLETTVGSVQPLLRLLSGAVALVLLLACSNFANLLLARTTDRIHEMGVRVALGAERSRLVRLMLTESVLLSMTGGLLGGLLSGAAIKILTKLNPGDIPRFEETSLDARVLSFGLLISLATGFGAGLYPAVSSARIKVNGLLAQGGRGLAGASWRARNVLIVAEVALAVMLLAGAGLLVRSYLIVQGEDKGFSPATLTMNLDLTEQPLHPPVLPQEGQKERKRTVGIFRDVFRRLRELPGIAALGAIDDLPLSHSEDVGFIDIEGYQHVPGRSANLRLTSGQYFQAMQIRLLAGRYLNDRDISKDPEAPPEVVVVSQSLAKLYFPGGSAVGRRLRLGKERWRTIVGVVADVRHTSLEEVPKPIVYAPSWLAGTVAIRTTRPTDVMIGAIRNSLKSVHEISLSNLQSMDDYVSEATARRKFQTVVLASFAGIAVLLVLVGLYGLLSYAVRQRTAELGVRIALGASRGDILRLILRYGVTHIAAGLVIGLAVSFVLTRGMASLLYGVSAADPVTFVAIPAIMLSVGVVACLVPAWKAARTDPITALRHQ